MAVFRAKTAELATGRWPGILQELGIDLRFLRKKHGPCPACGGKDRFRFDDKGGRGTWFCSHCGAGDGFMLLQRVYGWEFSYAAAEVDRLIALVPAGSGVPEQSAQYRQRALHDVWNASRVVTRGDPVWRYLHRRTGIDVVPADLRFHPALRYLSDDGVHAGSYPAMLALMRYPDGKVASIHRTYLTPEGEKAPVPAPKKVMPGLPLRSAAVRLSQVIATVGIAEGIETALAAYNRFCVPVWAATSAVLLAQWVPPRGVARVLIAGDNDLTYTGQAATFSLARRLARAGYAVDIRIPEKEGTDWADAPIDDACSLHKTGDS